MPISLKESVKAQDLINEIRLQWNTAAFHQKVLIMVEGKDDKTFYFKFFNPSQSELKTCKGCRKLKDVYTSIRNSLTIECIAIKDSDFDRLNHIRPIDENFFYTDCHDYEMMCLADEQVKKELFDNLAITYEP
ncbi:conserved domain protein [Bacteroides sp. CAG:875]|nr:conserved domain protein [Bacteroides sp. CAG:875]